MFKNIVAITECTDAPAMQFLGKWHKITHIKWYRKPQSNEPKAIRLLLEKFQAQKLHV